MGPAWLCGVLYIQMGGGGGSSTFTGGTAIFVGVSLSNTLQSWSGTGETQDMQDVVGCCPDITEMMLNTAKKDHSPFHQ